MVEERLIPSSKRTTPSANAGTVLTTRNVRLTGVDKSIEVELEGAVSTKDGTKAKFSDAR